MLEVVRESELGRGLVARARSDPELEGDHVTRSVLLDDHSHAVRQDLARRSGYAGLRLGRWPGAGEHGAAREQDREHQGREARRDGGHGGVRVTQRGDGTPRAECRGPRDGVLGHIADDEGVPHHATWCICTPFQPCSLWHGT